MSISIGSTDIPAWAVLGVFFAGGFYFMEQGDIPAIYDLFGFILPLQDIAVSGVLLVLAIGLLYQFRNIL